MTRPKSILARIMGHLLTVVIASLIAAVFLFWFVLSGERKLTHAYHSWHYKHVVLPEIETVFPGVGPLFTRNPDRFSRRAANRADYWETYFFREKNSLNFCGKDGIGDLVAVPNSEKSGDSHCLLETQTTDGTFLVFEFGSGGVTLFRSQGEF